MDVSTLAIRSGLDRTTVSQALNSTGAVPSERTVGHLARALGLDADLLLQLQRAACAPQEDEPQAPTVLGKSDRPPDTVASLDPGALEALLACDPATHADLTGPGPVANRCWLVTLPLTSTRPTRSRLPTFGGR